MLSPWLELSLQPVGHSKVDSMKRLILFLLIGLPSWGQISHVASSSNSNDSNATTIATSSALSISSGDLIIVGAQGSSAVSSLVCGSNTLTQAVTADAGGFPISIWYITNAVAGSCSPTASYSPDATYRRIAASHYTGAATSSVLDKTSCNAVGCASSTSHATDRTAQNVATTAQNNELLVAMTAEYTTHTFTEANSFVRRTAASGIDYSYFDKAVTATGGYPAGNICTVDDGSDDNYVSVFATFKAANSGSGSTPSKRVIVVQ